MSSKLRAVLVRFLLLLVAIGALAVALLIPPSARTVTNADWTPERPIVRGAYHVHSQRSDGSGTVDEIAAAAAQEKLDFVILTDHGDATRTADPPTYRSGVLCIDGVEISTSGGHYVALDLPPAPYPLGGSPASVVEDVARLGGLGIVAHPDSAKPELRWGNWDAGFNGLEWLNADSEWRDESSTGLARLLVTYWFRPVETLASALDRPVATIERWDTLTGQRRVPALAGADAHARIGVDRDDPYAERAVVHMPSYSVSFRTFQNRVILETPFRGDATADGAALLGAIREGRTFTTIDGLAPAGPFEFVGRSGTAVARAGEYLDPQGAVSLEGRVAAPADAAVLVLRDGAPVSISKESSFKLDIGTQPGAYRVEVRLAGQLPVPWLFSNPIYVGLRDRHRAEIGRAPHERAIATMVRELAFSGGQAEADPRSTSLLVPPGPGDAVSPTAWTFRLGDGARAGQYAAVRVAVADVAAVNRVTMRVSADRPMRAWLQLRAPAAALAEGERWGASFYADGTEREVTVFFDELAPVGVTASVQPALERIDSLLFVADTVNSQPGAENTLRVSGLTLAR
jgi:hypothetical protein